MIGPLPFRARPGAGCWFEFVSNRLMGCPAWITALVAATDSVRERPPVDGRSRVVSPTTARDHLSPRSPELLPATGER